MSLLANHPNPNGIQSSKASGEPPMALSGSAYLAIQEAIFASRREAGVTDFVNLPVPLSVQTIQQHCLTDKIVDMPL